MNDKKILNIGCGFDQTIGTEFIDKYPQAINVRTCDIDVDPIPFLNDTFDEVYSANVFEHLRNPSHFMSEAYRVLKPDGVLVIETDQALFYSIGNKAHGGNYEKEKTYGEEDKHYMLFTKNHMINWLTSSGFVNVKVEQFAYEKMFYWLAKIVPRAAPHLRAIGYKIREI